MGDRELAAPVFTIKIPMIAIANGVSDGWTDFPPAQAGESFLTYPRRAAELVVFGSAKVDDARATKTHRKILEFCIGRLPAEMIVQARRAGLRPD
jgi:hypothetical protein